METALFGVCGVDIIAAATYNLEQVEYLIAERISKHSIAARKKGQRWLTV